MGKGWNYLRHITCDSHLCLVKLACNINIIATIRGMIPTPCYDFNVIWNTSSNPQQKLFPYRCMCWGIIFQVQSLKQHTHVPNVGSLGRWLSSTLSGGNENVFKGKPEFLLIQSHRWTLQCCENFQVFIMRCCCFGRGWPRTVKQNSS